MKGKDAMKLTQWTLSVLAVSLFMGSAIAQDKGSATPPKAQEAGGHEPPPQAYTDCVGKKAGETIQHTTREGKVAASCEESPKGLVARPKRPGGPVPNGPGK